MSHPPPSHTLWTQELMDGKIYKRGQDDDAPTAALMIPHGAAHGTHAATLLELPDSAHLPASPMPASMKSIA